MKLQRTQIYLPSETHRRLSRDAADRGTSLAGYVREVVEEHYSRRGARGHDSFAALIGCVDEAPPGDVARDGNRYRDAALEDRLRKKLGGIRTRTRQRPRR